MTLNEMLYLENKKYSEGKISKKKVVKESLATDIKSEVDSRLKGVTASYQTSGGSVSVTFSDKVNKDFIRSICLKYKTLTKYTDGKSFTFSIPKELTKDYLWVYRDLSRYEIPYGVVNIGDSAFVGDSSGGNIKSVKVPDSVKTIGPGAFQGMRELTKVNIPEGVTEIEDYAFNFCVSLKEIRIPRSVINIGNKAFSDCRNLKVSFEGDINDINIAKSAFWDTPFEKEFDNILKNKKSSKGLFKVGDRYELPDSEGPHGQPQPSGKFEVVKTEGDIVYMKPLDSSAKIWFKDMAGDIPYLYDSDEEVSKLLKYYDSNGWVGSYTDEFSDLMNDVINI